MQELPANLDEALNLAHEQSSSTSSSITTNPPTSTAPTAAIPPAMAERKELTTDDVLHELNRSPLFMTELDDADGENMDLEALKALAYEGTKAEVAGNFREQGNECARVKRWGDAREFYDKGLAVLKDVKAAPEVEKKERRDGGEGPAEVDWLDREGHHRREEEEVVDEEAEREKERVIEEACYVNRALCNLELSTYDPSTNCLGPTRLVSLSQAQRLVTETTVTRELSLMHPRLHLHTKPKSSKHQSPLPQQPSPPFPRPPQARSRRLHSPPHARPLQLRRDLPPEQNHRPQRHPGRPGAAARSQTAAQSPGGCHAKASAER